MTERLRSKIVRLAKAGHSVVDIAVECMVSYQVVRTIVAHDVPVLLVPQDKPETAARAAPEAPVKRPLEPRSRTVEAPSERPVVATPAPVRMAVPKVVPAPHKVVASPRPKRVKTPGTEAKAVPRADAPAPAAAEESRILSETPPKRPERVSSVSETEREKRAELVREAVVAGRVTKLPPGSAARLSDIETRFHAAPLAAEQLKGAVGTRARMLAAGRNGRRRRLLK